MEDSHAIGDRLRRLRESKGMTQADLGQRIGLSQTSVAQIETGVTSAPRRGTLLKICEFFAVSEEWLRTGRNTTPADRPVAPIAQAAPISRPAPMLSPEEAAQLLIELAEAKGHIARLESAVEYQDEIIADLRADKTLLQRAYFGYGPPAATEDTADAPQPAGPEPTPGKAGSDSYAAGQERKYIGGQHRDPETGNVLLFSVTPSLTEAQAQQLVRGARLFTMPTPDPAIGQDEDEADAA